MSGNQLLELRKKIIEKDFSRMNNMQFKAVTTVKEMVKFKEAKCAAIHGVAKSCT